MNETPDQHALAERLSAIEAVVGALVRKLDQPDLRVMHDAVHALPPAAAEAARRWMPPPPPDFW